MSKSKKSIEKSTIGIALGGGGARGFAHLGILQALSERNITPAIIAGTSAGAIVGSFIAAGYSPKTTYEILQKHDLLSFTQPKIPKNGLLSLGNLASHLKKYIGAKDISDLKTPFHVAVSNMSEGKVEYHNEGPLPQWVQASAAIPIIFEPVTIDGAMFSDGGLFDNVPITPIEKQCDRIIAVNLHPIEPKEKIDDLIQMALRTFELSMIAVNNDLESRCDFLMQPPVGKFDILNSEHAEELYQIGYDYCKNYSFE